MSKNIKITAVSLLLFVSLIFTSCSKEKTAIENASDRDDNVLVVGVTKGPHSEILESIKFEMKKDGVILEIEEYKDYDKLNSKLIRGELDANYFQHELYLEYYNDLNHNQLVSAGKVHVEPMRLYSNKIIGASYLKENDIVGIPNDTVNRERALLFLEELGIIKLAKEHSYYISVDDIVENELNIKFEEFEAYELANQYKRLTAVILNYNVVVDLEADPDAAIEVESTDSKYANVVAVKKQKADDEKIKILMKNLTSDKTRLFILEEYGGNIIPTF